MARVNMLFLSWTAFIREVAVASIGKHYCHFSIKVKGSYWVSRRRLAGGRFQYWSRISKRLLRSAARSDTTPWDLHLQRSIGGESRKQKHTSHTIAICQLECQRRNYWGRTPRPPRGSPLAVAGCHHRQGSCLSSCIQQWAMTLRILWVEWWSTIISHWCHSILIKYYCFDRSSKKKAVSIFLLLTPIKCYFEP